MAIFHYVAVYRMETTQFDVTGKIQLDITLL